MTKIIKPGQKVKVNYEHHNYLGYFQTWGIIKSDENIGDETGAVIMDENGYFEIENVSSISIFKDEKKKSDECPACLDGHVDGHLCLNCLGESNKINEKGE